MLHIIKYSEMSPEDLSTIPSENFKCYKCGCTNINKLYALCITRPHKGDESKMDYISDCYCEDCCPFDMLTKFSRDYYLREECNEVASESAQLMLMAGFSKNEVVKKILKI